MTKFSKVLIAFYLLLIIHCSLFIANCYSQGTAINTTAAAADNSAMLDISSTNQGILIPRMTTIQRNAIPSPAIGLLIYNTTTDRFNYYKSSGWYELLASLLSSNKGTVNPGGGTAININGASADPSAILDVSSTTRGLLLPRTVPDSIISPATGLIIYDNVMNKYRYFDGTIWKTICETFIEITTGSGSLTSAGTAINTNNNPADNSAMLDISSRTKGLLIPRMSDSERNLLLPKKGLMVYENISTNTIDFYNGTNWYNLVTDPPTAPVAGTNVPSNTQIVWNWNTVTGATGYKYNTVNSYSSAIDNGVITSFTQTGLTCNTPYTLYVWAYNDCGNSVVTTLTQTSAPCAGFTCGTDKVTDIDGNVYNTVLIGAQCWFQENLKVTKYSSGAAIPNVTDNTAWSNLTSGAYCYYNNDINNLNVYGNLYNWYSGIDPRNICPAGWHVPSNADWTRLTNFLGGESIAGGKMKEAGTVHWKPTNTCGALCNISGFTSLPGGFRYFGSGAFLQINNFGYFLSTDEYTTDTTESYYLLNFYNSNQGMLDMFGKECGISVRCLKN